MFLVRLSAFRAGRHEVVLELVRGGHLLVARVLQADQVVGGRAVDVDVQVLVDRRAEDEPTMLA